MRFQLNQMVILTVHWQCQSQEQSLVLEPLVLLYWFLLWHDDD